MLDALIAGGGPGGAAAAIVLARTGRRVLLVDATPPEPVRPKAGESLPPPARSLLRDLGVLDRLGLEGQLRSSGTSSVWGSPRVESTDFVFDPNGSGWHLDRHRFDRSLRSAAAEAGAEVREGVAVRLMGGAEGDWRLRLGDGEEVAARTLVDATGRRAAIARALGARRDRRDRLVGIVGSVPAREDDRNARTSIEAVAEGWWYTALVPEKKRVIAFMTDSDLVPPGARTRAGFQALLSRTELVASLVGGAAIGLRTEPAHGSRLSPPAGDGWLAVGDAGLAFDPLSSQGMMTALYTGTMGARALDAFLAGDGAALAAYGERLATIAAAYERNLLYAYASESRWFESPFWARRHSLSRPPTAMPGPGGEFIGGSAG